MTKEKKPKVGFYGVTGCAGCLLSVIFNEENILDIVNSVDIVSFPFIKGLNSDEDLDICFIEGVVTNNDDLKMVKKLRERSKILIALGTCACQGNIPAIRNFTDEKELDYLKYHKREQLDDIGNPVPLCKVIKVDISLQGCPPDREEIKTFIKDTLLGKEYRPSKEPVCKECRLLHNGCLLDTGKICLGPVTNGGCQAVCPTSGFECYGCRGVNPDHNFDELFELLLSKGVSEIEIKKKIDTFMALEANEKLKGTKWETLH